MYFFLAKLANEHIDRVSKHEQKQQLMLKERQETFDEVFKGELEAYKATGYIPSMCVSFHIYIFIKLITVKCV